MGVVRVCRGATVLAGVVLATVLGVGSAAAHVEIRVEPAQVGARDAVVTFTAAAERPTAGITALEVQVPEGISPSDVTFVSGPQGWTLLPTTDGYIVSGQPLPAGEQARYVITVKQLPNAPSLAFKTLQTYSDGTIDRWIELPVSGGEAPAHPAPVAVLAAAGAVAPPPPPTDGHAHPTDGHAHPAEAQPQSAGGSGVPVVVWVGLVVLAAAVVVVVVLRRRASAPAGKGDAA